MRLLVCAIKHHLCVAVVGRDDDFAAGALHGGRDAAYAGVQGFDGFNGRG